MNKPFDTVLRDLRHGECLDEITEQFGQLVAACANTGKKGEMSLKIILKPSSNGAVIEVVDDVKFKIPELSKGSSIFFPTPENNLVKNDPRQPQLEGLKEVAQTQTATLKEVAA